MLVYIAGPMTGLLGFNYDAFNHAESVLNELGYDVLNPARNFDGDQTLPREVYMRECFQQVLKCDTVVVLDGWQNSHGALTEVNMAKELSLPVLRLDDMRACEVFPAYSQKDADSVIGVALVMAVFGALCLMTLAGWL